MARGKKRELVNILNRKKNRRKTISTNAWLRVLYVTYTINLSFSFCLRGKPNAQKDHVLTVVVCGTRKDSERGEGETD